MKLNQHIELDYDDVVSMCDNLAHVVNGYAPDLLVGLSRGGLVPAVHLSHRLGVPMRPIIWQTRDGGERHIDPYIVDAIKQKKTVVFVDDINDSGATFQEIAKFYIMDKGLDCDNVFFAALVEKISSGFVCGATALKINDPRWIIFPWESEV